ncbi:metal ABC transporter permease [Xylocopilactobacillus apicola]|uniref:ABC transporter n=1 Tax=Xylocopilactobacillus apicola TaxID=2932184 RepID=A0AAU9D2L7_9LACO|nr:metal ABC transporter permease [Xylocopilactobacillus apicola]BDR59031.1 ABC transporter [Xylocopilactobacillus apicola]
MLNSEFMLNAFIAGTLIAVVCGVMSIFVLIRKLPFLTHMISEIGFSGAAFGVFAGLPPITGMLIFTTLAAVLTSVGSNKFSSNDSLVSVISALFMGSGALFLTLAKGNSSYATNLMFGSITAITKSNVYQILIVAGIVLITILLLFRPLKYDSFDPIAARYSSLKTYWISLIFLVMTAFTASVAAQIVGALLIFVLMTLPASIAFRWGRNFFELILISISCALIGVWGGLYLTYLTNLPVTFFITLIEAILYFTTLIAKRIIA